MLDWKIDDLVVCVDTNWIHNHPWMIFPIKDQIYSIRGFREETGCDISVYLNEIINRKSPPKESSFYYWHFRKVKETDISELEKLLKIKPKTKEKELENV